MKNLIVPFMEFKMDPGQPGRFRGYGSTFGNVDLVKDVCVRGCFTKSLKETKDAGHLPAMYWMHDPKEPVGDWLEVDEDAKGLPVEGQLWTGDNETECSRKAMNILKGTGPKGLSMGYNTVKKSRDPKTGVRSLEEVKLLEISVVGYGANPKALVTHIKSLFEDGEVPTVREVEELLRDAGFSANQAKAFIADGFKAIERDAEALKKSEDEITELKALRDIFRPKK